MATVGKTTGWTKTPSSVSRSLNRPAVYRITVQGRLDPSWSAWFEGASIATGRESGASVTILTVDVVDQAVLHGLLSGIRDLGLTLVRVERVEIK